MGSSCKGSTRSSAPLAPQTFNNGVRTASADSGTAGTGFVFDAGAPPDSGTAVCVPGSLSVPYALKDPCNQVMSTCALMGSLSISTCQSDGTWGLPCVCQNMLGGGLAGTGTGGSAMFGSGGSSF